ncbi:hypothetical protein PsorP6_011258 [Peronosclerospora sorghi]|uniref:Uncharacterized protein n=1 Tax=Peronosclerospora sorghi TaxID=230839 RepID=A0ACC0WJR3_9STRA|nr:hypothetical protein PsorP6_011258 [Peronosclerospora sorghi]
MCRIFCLEHFHDFKTIGNTGISFNCTDRDRLPDDATDGVIYDWFVDHGTRPVYITPARVIEELRSRSLRVYFNPKTVPKCVVVDPRTPLRQIQLTGQGFTVVHHPINAYNQHVPTFTKEIEERQIASKEIMDKKTAAKESKDKQNSANKDKKTASKESKDKQASAKKVSLKPGTPTPAPPKEGKKGKAPPAEDERSDVIDNVSDNAVMDASDSDDDNGSILPSFEERSDSSDNADMNFSYDDNARPSITTTALSGIMFPWPLNLTLIVSHKVGINNSRTPAKLIL